MSEVMVRRPQTHLRPSGSPTVELVRYTDVLPVFILGSVRSGTSAMMQALREGAEIRGFNEGVLGQLLPVLLSALDHHYNAYQQKPATMLGSVSQDFMAAGIKNLFGKAFAETMGDGRWLDKTPGGPLMVAACPTLLEIFPSATFIFCKRRGVENVLSRQRKFPNHSFEAHCDGWAKTMEAWLDMRPRLGECTIEIDQRDMAVDPVLVSEKVGSLLGLSAAQRDGVLGVLRSKRVEQTRPAEDDVLIRIEDTGWTEAEQDTFRRACGPMMEAFGYGPGEDRSPELSARYRFFAPVANGMAERENISAQRGCRALDATRFAITPNPHGEAPASIRHRMIEMERFRRFSARLRIAGRGARDGERVIFRFCLEKSSDRSPAFAAEQVVEKGGPLPWTCDLPELSGPFDAVLSVRPMSKTEDMQLSAIWIDAQLT